MGAIKFQTFEVGGFVRDDLLGIPSKDRDCSMVVEDADLRDTLTVDQAFTAMRDQLVNEGFSIFEEKPDKGTVRARSPIKGELASDFVLARKEGPYSDGRRPDFVTVGSFEDDINRRDFTVNAIARDPLTGEIIDLHNGLADLETRTLRFVGDPMERITEDALRVMRAIRFTVTKGFTLDIDSLAALFDPKVPELLARISDERRDAELAQMFSLAPTTVVLGVLGDLTPELLEAIFAGSVRLTSTMKKGGKKR